MNLFKPAKPNYAYIARKLVKALESIESGTRNYNAETLEKAKLRLNLIAMIAREEINWANEAFEEEQPPSS